MAPQYRLVPMVAALALSGCIYTDAPTSQVPAVREWMETGPLAIPLREDLPIEYLYDPAYPDGAPNRRRGGLFSTPERIVLQPGEDRYQALFCLLRSSNLSACDGFHVTCSAVFNDMERPVKRPCISRCLLVQKQSDGDVRVMLSGQAVVVWKGDGGGQAYAAALDTHTLMSLVRPPEGGEPVTDLPPCDLPDATTDGASDSTAGAAPSANG